jgi:DNA-binding transcriptional MerR regulator
VDRLQQILFYRELGLKLQENKKIVTAASFDELKALREHRLRLLDRRKQLNKLIANVDQTIAAKEGGRQMTDQEKFACFKEKMIADNERQYGQEVKAKYGTEAVERSQEALRGMSKEQYQEWEKLGQSIIETLKAAFATGDPKGELAQKTADLHRRWLSMAWGSYSSEAHRALAQMYVEDERFAAFYNQHQSGGAEFLRDAILIYTEKK